MCSVVDGKFFIYSVNNSIFASFFVFCFYFKLKFIPCEAEWPLRGMELQKK